MTDLPWMTRNVIVGEFIAVPEWIKNNADWWAEGAIDDEDFVQGIQYLISNGILQVTLLVHPTNVPILFLSIIV